MIYILAAFLLSMFAFAWFVEAPNDARDIRERKPIDHAYRLERRVSIGAFIFAVAGLLFSLWRLHHSAHWWLPVTWVPMGWAVWTSTFRARLNALRGLDWRYIGIGAWYDRMFLRSIGFDVVREGERFGFNYRNSPGFARDIHRAGLFAYIFEAGVFAAGLVAFIVLGR